MAAEPLATLSVRGVTKSFGGLVAVDDMSFELAEHEVLGLIGPNGSGKTTMINLISGALKASRGEIVLFGENVVGESAHAIARRGVARTFQLVRMLESMSVLENVETGGVFGHARRWGAELRDLRGTLTRVGLAERRQPVGALTYIDQSWWNCPRARLRPRVLLLDEWLAGLNPTELLTGIALVEDLRGEGRTIVVVEHVMDAIRSLCDRCVVMNSGAKIAEGTPREVLADAAVITAYLGDEDV